MDYFCKPVALARALALSLCLTAGCSRKPAEPWVVPSNPDPETILSEAEQDAAAKRYENALAKHVWFHENAIKIRPSLYGVRLSFALSAWVDLAKAYPPALEKLKSVREDAERAIREGQGARDLFHDFESINDYLGEEARTKELFVWLDSNAPSLAKKVFDLAQASLVKAKQYELCNKYLDPDASFQRMLKVYRQHERFAQSSKYGNDHRELAEKQFSHDVATLIALLTLNNRTNEAGSIAAAALKEWRAPKFQTLLERALKGEVPEPRP